MSEINKKDILTVSEFVNKYNNRTSEKIKEDFIRSIVHNCYIDYEVKNMVCNKIVSTSSYIKDRKGNDKLHFNSVVKYMLYCLNIIDLYTNIKIDFKNSLSEYNELNKYGLVQFIFNEISENEKNEFTAILQMVEEDLIRNEYESHAFISNQIERFNHLISETLNPIINGLVSSSGKINEKKINAFMDKIKNALK